MIGDRDVIREIAARCPGLLVQATRALGTRTTSPQRRSALAANALRDPEGNWTPDERRRLAGMIEPTQARSRQVQVRLSDAEHGELAARAGMAGQTMSDYIRSVAIGGDQRGGDR